MLLRASVSCKARAKLRATKTKAAKASSRAKIKTNEKENIVIGMLMNGIMMNGDQAEAQNGALLPHGLIIVKAVTLVPAPG